MNSRDKILKAIAINKPELISLPLLNLEEVISYENSITQFKYVVESIGGTVKELNNIHQLKEEINAEKKAGNFNISTINETEEIDPLLHTLKSEELESLHKAYIKGSIGVAENGAIWLYESEMINRLLPFICQHLVLAIEKKDIVSTLHHAYEKINVFKEGFGVFISGPSKTADIEQSLVIGAHGARSLTVYLL